jgi:hypothetical protein
MYQYGLYSVYFLASELDLLQARVVHNFIGPCEITLNVIPDCLGHSVDAYSSERYRCFLTASLPVLASLRSVPMLVLYSPVAPVVNPPKASETIDTLPLEADPVPVYRLEP